MTLAQMYELYKNTYTAFVDVGDVTYSNSAGTATVTEVKARKCIPEQRELAKLGPELALQTDLATFILWDVSLDGTEPKGNGKITWTDGTVWTIQASWREHFDTQWRCLCRKDK